MISAPASDDAGETLRDRPPVYDLDAAQIGGTVVMAVAVAAMAGHTRPAATLRDYCHRVATPEGQFVRDVFTKTTEEISDRWYGGQLNAARLAAEAVAPLFAND